MSLYTSDRARRSLIDTVAFRALSQVATVLGYVVMVRGMTKEDFGVLNLLYAFIPFVSTAASLGLEQTLRRYQPEYLKSGNAIAAHWLFRFVASARFGANVVLLALILLAWNQIAPLFKLTAFRSEFVILCLLIVIHFQARVLELTLASHMLQRYSVGSIVIVNLVKLAAYAVLAWQGELTLDYVLYADIGAFAVAYVFLRFAYVRYCLPSVLPVRYRPDAVERRRLLRYGLFNNFNDAGTLFLDRKTDHFFIAAIIDPIAVGVYAFYSRLNEMIQNLLPARLFGGVVQPMFFSTLPEEAAQRIPERFSLLINLNLVLMWPVLVYSIVYNSDIVDGVFGGRFLEYSWLLPVIVLFEMFNVAAIPATLVAQYEEKAGVILLSKVFAVLNVGALLVLLPIFGIAGAVFASGASTALKNGFIWWRVRQLARWTNAGVALAASFALWGVVGGLCWIVKATMATSPIVNLGVGVMLVGFAALFHMRGPALSSTDRAMLAKILSGREARILRWAGISGCADLPLGKR